MKQVIAMHGWSGDSNNWQLWLNHFQKYNWVWQSGERGYGSLSPLHPHWRGNTETQPIDRKVIIGHSLGIHLLPSKTLRQATEIVLLGSFSHFLPKEQIDRVLQTTLKRMLELLGTKDEQAMLNAFLMRACQPESTSSLPRGPIQEGLSPNGRKRLKADLELLIRTSELPSGFPKTARVLVVEGEEDNIVIPSIREALIKDLKSHLAKAPDHWIIPGAGHALLQPELINLVLNWLERTQ